MTEIHNTDEKFVFDDLVFLKPIAIPGGNFFIRIRKNNSALYLQPPQCKTKQGIVKTGKKYYSDLMFTNENEDFIRWMETLESHCQKVIFDNRMLWFEGDMDMHDIENYFTSPIKLFKSGKFYITRTNVSLISGEPTLKIYDENENQLDIDSINDKTSIMTVLEIQGIKFSARSFQIEIELKQIMTLSNNDIFEKCVLKPISSKESRPIIETNNYSLIEDNKVQIEKRQHIEPVIERIVTSPSPDLTFCGENTQVETLPSRIYNDKEVISDPSAQIFLTSDNVIENRKNKTDYLEEVDFDLEELPKDEAVQLKQRNDVYYEMYREAKRKARIARDLALSSYLEAKRIKNTYMLDEVKDSDESDLEREEDQEIIIESTNIDE